MTRWRVEINIFARLSALLRARNEDHTSHRYDEDARRAKNDGRRRERDDLHVQVTVIEDPIEELRRRREGEPE